MKINYISYLETSEQSGGQSGVNTAVYDELKKHFEVEYIGPVHPQVDSITRLSAKLRRFIGGRSSYAFYSDKRLNQIASEIERQAANSQSDACYFHSFTPWIAYKTSLPYVAFNDACFATYHQIYNEGIKFHQSDLHRIYDMEARWISEASTVFFRSQWALNEAVKHYGISNDNLKVTGPAGFIKVPKQDLYDGVLNFTFISKEFLPKGGQLVVDAIKFLSKEYPAIHLNLVGDTTGAEGLNHPNITTHGVINKSIPEQKDRFNHIMQQTFVLVHPTSKDVNPLVIIEAAYFGIPTIAPKSFAIPELIQDGFSGKLMDVPFTWQDVASQMKWMIENKMAYQEMRKNARQNALQKYTWDTVGNEIANALTNAVPKYDR